MKIEAHHINDTKIAEVISDVNVINKVENGLDLLGNLYYHGFDRMIIHEKNITPEFFDLKNRMAGEILQKFSNYRIRLAIVGDRTQQLTGAGERRMQINNVHPVVVAATIRRLLKLRIPAEEDSMAISYVCNHRAYFSA